MPSIETLVSSWLDYITPNQKNSLLIDLILLFQTVNVRRLAQIIAHYGSGNYTKIILFCVFQPAFECCMHLKAGRNPFFDCFQTVFVD